MKKFSDYKFIIHKCRKKMKMIGFYDTDFYPKWFGRELWKVKWNFEQA